VHLKVAVTSNHHAVEEKNPNVVKLPKKLLLVMTSQRVFVTGCPCQIHCEFLFASLRV
jgi:hypothetical protein